MCSPGGHSSPGAKTCARWTCADMAEGHSGGDRGQLRAIEGRSTQEGTRRVHWEHSGSTGHLRVDHGGELCHEWLGRVAKEGDVLQPLAVGEQEHLRLQRGRHDREQVAMLLRLPQVLGLVEVPGGRSAGGQWKVSGRSVEGRWKVGKSSWKASGSGGSTRAAWRASRWAAGAGA